MPLPPGILSVDLVVCERVLREMDGVPSAIRMVDLFNVPESILALPNPTIVFFAIVFVRGDVGAAGNFICRMQLSDPNGNEIGIAQQAVSVNPVVEGAPGGAVTLGLFNVIAVIGTYRLRVFLDDELQAQTTITTLRVPE